MPIFQLVAILASTLFSGAAIYINLVEHPARMACGTALAATVFGPSYTRAAVMQVILALAATIGGVGAWWMGAPEMWLVGALVLFAVIPFTLIAIMPTNRKLLNPALDRGSEPAHRLLVAWGRLHAVRSVLGACCLAYVCLLGDLVCSPAH